MSHDVCRQSLEKKNPSHFYNSSTQIQWFGFPDVINFFKSLDRLTWPEFAQEVHLLSTDGH